MGIFKRIFIAIFPGAEKGKPTDSSRSYFSGCMDYGHCPLRHTVNLVSAGGYAARGQWRDHILRQTRVGQTSFTGGKYSKYRIPGDSEVKIHYVKPEWNKILLLGVSIVNTVYQGTMKWSYITPNQNGTNVIYWG